MQNTTHKTLQFNLYAISRKSSFRYKKRLVVAWGLEKEGLPGRTENMVKGHFEWETFKCSTVHSEGTDDH